MLYLFNSAYRPRYLRNVLNTLFVPVGGTNKYRYRFRSPSGETTHANIDKLSHSDLLGYSSGGEVCIIYVDRFATGGYTYHPLRFARFIKAEDINDYLHFHVQLGQFVYPQNTTKFNSDVCDHLYPHNIPQLTNNYPRTISDGYYAVKADNLFSQKDDFVYSDAAWTKCVAAIESCKAFADNENAEPVFVRCSLVSDKDKKPSAPILSNTTAVYSINRAQKYTIELAYVYPAQRTDTSATATLSCELGDSLRGLPAKDLNIDSLSDNQTYTFRTKRYIEDNNDAISFEFSSRRPDVEIIGADAKLEIRVNESVSYWVNLVLALILFSLLSVVIATDFDSIKPLTPGGVLSAVWLKALAGLVQALVLFWLFKLVGRKLF